MNSIYILQKKVVRIITGNDKLLSQDYSLPNSTPLFYETKILNVFDIYKLCISKFVFSCLKLNVRIQFTDFFTYGPNNHNTLASRKKHLTPIARTTTYGLNSIRNSGAHIWNDIPIEIRESKSLNIFTKIFKHFLNSEYVV